MADLGQSLLVNGEQRKKSFSTRRRSSTSSRAFALNLSAEDQKQRAEALKEVLGKETSYYAKADARELLEELQTDESNGLSEAEAERRLQQYGRNELAKDPPTPLWRMFLAQFEDLLVLLLCVSCVVSFILGQYAAASTIVVIVICNAILGVLMESKAGAALEALEALTSPMIRVLRQGNIVTVASPLVVVGDIVIISNGDRIPADIRVIQARNLSTNEASLTGEARPVKKLVAPAQTDGHSEVALTEQNMVYMGTEVLEGNGTGVVVKTGMSSRMGEVAALLAGAEQEDSPLQQKLHRLGVRLGIASIAISVLVLIIGITTGRGTDPNSTQKPWLQMLLVAVSLTVAAVPEGLPACVTITLAVGMKHMSERNAWIRNLHSVETLGSASVICTDKTGTLTTGIMTVTRLWCAGERVRVTGQGYHPEGKFYCPDEAPDQEKFRRHGGSHVFLLSVAALACDDKTRLSLNAETNTWECTGNPNEKALIVAAAKADVTRESLKDVYQVVVENPFDSVRKLMSTLVQVLVPEKSLFNEQYAACVKGAPNILLEKCSSILVDDHGLKPRPMTDQDREAIIKVVDEWSSKMYRVLAVGFRPMEDLPPSDDAQTLERDLVFVGLVASVDPPRDGVDHSIKKAARAGVRTIMITGDYIKTAVAIAESIRLLPINAPPEKAIDCDKYRTILEDSIKDPKYSPEATRAIHELDKVTAYADVYARAKPVDKLALVKSLKRQGHVAAMTGDGVNDAPALRESSIGVAMGKTGTEVARSAADMVLTDDNFVSIVEAIEQGRVIYANISKFVFYLLSTNIAEVFVILIAVVAGYPSPLVPTQILWLNLCTDGCPAIALAVELKEPGVMDEGPRPKEENLIEKVMITGLFVHNILLTAVVLLVYVWTLAANTNSWQPGKPDWMTQADYKQASARATTATIITIVFAELGRAYTSRSLRQSLFRIGVFSNRWMQYSVAAAIGATILVVTIPGLRETFGCTLLAGEEYAYLLIVVFLPALGDEILKLIYRFTKFGERPRVISAVEEEVILDLALDDHTPLPTRTIN